MKLKLKLKLKLTVSSLVIALALTGCGESENKSSLVKDEKFEAYLNFKRIPLTDEKRVASALVVYNEREAISKAIEKSDLLDKSLIDVEVAEFKKQMLISRYFEAYIKKNVTPEAIKNYYNNNQDEYQNKKIHVAHILFRTNGRMSDEEKNARLLKAKEAHARLQQNEKFEDLAKEYSDDKLSAQKGGDLGWLDEGSIDPVFSRTVFAMDAGAVSEPFVTSYGYHIVKVIEAAKTTTKPFDAVKGDIAYKLKEQAKQAEMNRLKEQAKK